MIEFRIQEKTRSLNESFRGDWRPRAAVAKRQRTKAMKACPKWPGMALLVVRLTRVSPGTLDGDSVPAALKHVRDGVADRLKIDDASPLVAWEYHQAKGEAEVVVQMWHAGHERPPLPEGRPVAKKLGKALAVVAADAAKRLRVVLAPGTGESGGTRRIGGHVVATDAFYLPPRSKPVNAAKEAEEAFAPARREAVHFRGISGSCTCSAAAWENCR
jgi:hypothetical protein